jgi:hypothetical protein
MPGYDHKAITQDVINLLNDLAKDYEIDRLEGGIPDNLHTEGILTVLQAIPAVMEAKLANGEDPVYYYLEDH